MKNVLELIRVSTEAQAGEEKGGIPAQKAINRRTARAYGLDIVKSIEIVDVSGSRVLQSPGMQELLRLMELPEISGVVTREFSRLFRPERFDDYALLQYFIDTECTFYLPDGPIDLASKSGRLLGTIRAALAGLERREIVERMMDAKEALRKAGKHPGGTANLPYGVGYSKERGWYYTLDAEKVKQAFSLFLSGRGYGEIANRLNFPRTTVRFILQNPIYCGWRLYDKKRDLSPSGYVPRPGGRQGYRRKIKRAPEEIIRVRVLDGLVREEDFQRVQEVIELKRQKHWRSHAHRPARYTYNGYLICGDCASLIYTHTSREEFYVCKSHRPREKKNRDKKGLASCTNGYMLRKKLEAKIDELLGIKIREPDFLRPLLEAYNDRVKFSQPTPAIDERAVTAKLNALGEKRQRILETFFESIIGKEERDRRLGPIDRKISTYENLLMECSPQTEKRPVLDLESVLAVVEPFAEWEFLDREDQRAMLRALCPEISVYRYSVKGLTLNLSAGGEHRDEGSPAAGAMPRPFSACCQNALA